MGWKCVKNIVHDKWMNEKYMQYSVALRDQWINVTNMQMKAMGKCT